MGLKKNQNEKEKEYQKAIFRLFLSMKWKLELTFVFNPRLSLSLLNYNKFKKLIISLY